MRNSVDHQLIHNGHLGFTTNWKSGFPEIRLCDFRCSGYIRFPDILDSRIFAEMMDARQSFEEILYIIEKPSCLKPSAHKLRTSPHKLAQVRTSCAQVRAQVRAQVPAQVTRGWFFYNNI